MSGDAVRFYAGACVQIEYKRGSEPNCLFLWNRDIGGVKEKKSKSTSDLKTEKISNRQLLFI